MLKYIIVVLVPVVIIIGKGNKKVISISNTKNTTAKRKNRRENAVRAEFFGSNPHSKGLSFSRSKKLRVAITRARKIRRSATISEAKVI
jgi:hypothetical protein